MPCVLLYDDFTCSTHATSCWSDLLSFIFIRNGKDWPKINFLQIWDKLPEWKQTSLYELINTLPPSSLNACIVLYPHTSEGTVLSVCDPSTAEFSLRLPSTTLTGTSVCRPAPYNLHGELTDWYRLVFSISNVFFLRKPLILQDHLYETSPTTHQGPARALASLPFTR